MEWEEGGGAIEKRGVCGRGYFVTYKLARQTRRRDDNVETTFWERFAARIGEKFNRRFSHVNRIGRRVQRTKHISFEN